MQTLLLAKFTALGKSRRNDDGHSILKLYNSATRSEIKFYRIYISFKTE